MLLQCCCTATHMHLSMIIAQIKESADSPAFSLTFYIFWIIFLTNIKFLKLYSIQMWAEVITHLKYWFRFSSILEGTKNSTKTSNTSFEKSDSRLSKFWRLRVWHSYWPTKPTCYDKLNFFRRRGRGKPMMLPHPCPSRIFLSSIRAFKRGILCLCTICTFLVNWVQSSKYGIFLDFPS